MKKYQLRFYRFLCFLKEVMEGGEVSIEGMLMID
jgi:hypothetical protein